MRLRILIAAALFAAGTAQAAEIKVIGSPGFREAYTALLPGFEKATGDKITTIWGGVNDIAKRVADGETADIVILPAKQIDGLIEKGKLMRETRADVARSGVGVATRKGAPRIDISTSDGLKKALLAANRISYSTGPSGVHMADVIRSLGIEDRVKGKIVIAPSDTPVGDILAHGQADIGFQQVSELIRIKGIDYLGPLPADIQETTVFSAAVHKNAASGEAARALVRYLSAPEAASAIRKTGMEPG
jgi:molybdate transport system substrate-binding protein